MSRESVGCCEEPLTEMRLELARRLESKSPKSVLAYDIIKPSIDRIASQLEQTGDPYFGRSYNNDLARELTTLGLVTGELTLPEGLAPDQIEDWVAGRFARQCLALRGYRSEYEGGRWVTVEEAFPLENDGAVTKEPVEETSNEDQEFLPPDKYRVINALEDEIQARQPANRMPRSAAIYPGNLGARSRGGRLMDKEESHQGRVLGAVVEVPSRISSHTRRALDEIAAERGARSPDYSLSSPVDRERRTTLALAIARRFRGLPVSPNLSAGTLKESS